MSFGASSRGTQGASKKPVPFWEQQAMESKKRGPSKSNKYVKEQKFPLRGRGEQPPPPQQKLPPQKPAVNRRPVNPPPRTNRNKGSEIQPGMVTLTQKQLDAILSTVGTLVSQNDELQKSHNVKGWLQEQQANENGVHLDEDRPESPENILRLADSARKPRGEEPKPSSRGSGPKVLEPDEIPGLGTIEKDHRVVEPSSVPGLDGYAVSPAAVPGLSPRGPSAPSTIPKAHMSKAELKRIQWERERADVDVTLTKTIGPSPLLGIGGRKPPTRLAELKPSTPRAHLTRAERRRRESEEARTMPLSPGRTLTEFWSNEPRKAFQSPRDNDQPPGIPRAHLTKAEKKRQQWEAERAENQALIDGQQMAPPRQTVSHAPSISSVQQYEAAPSRSKAEQKRLQWERERAENEALKDASQSAPRQPSVSQAPISDHLSQEFVTAPPGSKAERKRLQWERERAENEAREAMARGTAHNQKPLTNQQATSPSNHSVLPPTVGVPKGQLSKAELKRLQWEQERAEVKATGANNWLDQNRQANTQQQPPVPNIQNTPPTVGFRPKEGLSKSELKRQQWQRERAELQAEQQQEYSPWGKPGAGAPIRDLSGNILSDYNQRQDEVDVRQSQQRIIQQQRDNRPPVSSNMADTQQQPAAIRSSFVIGGAAPDGDRYTNIKEREKKAWLEELEKQMEEKKQKKELEKERRRQEELKDTWADRFQPPADRVAPKQEPAEELRISSAPQVAPSTVPGLDPDHRPPQDLNSSVNVNSQSGPVTHLRGQNWIVDEQTRREQDEKRQRQQAHQDAVKAQVEEQKRKKAEERERRAREELEEERKLQMERDSLQAMYDAERQKAKEKEEQQQRRVQQLKEAMDASAEQAHRERHERRMRKLQQGGHDTSMINANFEEGSGPPATDVPLTENDNESVITESAKMTPRTVPSGMLNVAPTSVPGLDLTPRDAVVSALVNHEVYEQDKVIVPSKYKAQPSHPYTDPMSPRREFGVQTELDMSGFQNMNLSRESSTEIEYKGPIKENTKKVRIKSSDNKQQETKKGSQKINQRPRWGGGTQQKRNVKQSERDPNFERKKLEREEKKLQRQRDMMELAEKSMAKVKEKTMRTRSKSRDRNSKSEQESRASVRGRGAQAEGRSRSIAGGNRRTNSPPVPVLRARSNPQSPPLPTHQQRRASSPETNRAGPVSHRSRVDTHRSQATRRTARETRENQPPAVNGYRSSSPPVPTLRKQPEPNSDPPINSFRSNSPPIPTMKQRLQNDYNLDAHAYENTKPSNLKQDSSRRQKYQDSDPLVLPATEGEFVPFLRTAEILDPKMAEEPLPVSREATVVQNARKAYVHGIQPANYGMKMANFEDRLLAETIPEMPQMPEVDWQKDPIMNPSLVTGHPTGRQDRILQQLSDLRRGLMQKQRELEVVSPMD